MRSSGAGAGEPDAWTLEAFVADDRTVPFKRLIDKLSDFKFAALDAAMTRVLAVRGLDPVRTFVHFHGAKVILLIGGYDKGGDPSERRQQREIREARRLLTQFQERQRRDRARTKRGRG